MITKEKQQESKKAGNMEDVSDMGAVIQSLKSELDQSEKRYLSAVKGRKEFRQLYRKSREKIAQLEKENKDLKYIISKNHPILAKQEKQLQSYKEGIEDIYDYCKELDKDQTWVEEKCQQLLKDAE